MNLTVGYCEAKSFMEATDCCEIGHSVFSMIYAFKIFTSWAAILTAPNKINNQVKESLKKIIFM